MDKHYLTPLFSPASIVAFVGPADDAGRQTPRARALRAALEASPGPHPPQGGRPCRGTAPGTGEICRSVAFFPISSRQADSGKLYALGSLLGTWQT